MRMRLFMLLVALGALPLHGAVTGAYRLGERTAVDAHGAALITLTITPDTALSWPLEIPFDRGTPAARMLLSDSTVSAEYILREGVPLLRLTGSHPCTGPLELRVQVDTLPAWRGLKAGDFGNRTVVLGFRNTTSRRITQYTGTLILPPGLTVTSVVSSEPAQTEKEPAAPFTIVQSDGRAGVSIRAAGLGLGDAARVTFRCKPAEHSPALLICCSLAGILYLIFFRNVLKDNGNGSSAT